MQHVLGDARLERHGLTGSWVCEREVPGVQGVPGDHEVRAYARGLGEDETLLQEIEGHSVDLIPDDRVAEFVRSWGRDTARYLPAAAAEGFRTFDLRAKTVHHRFE